MVERASGYFFCTFLTLFLLNVPFIVCDFVFAAKEGCAQFEINGMALTLQSWLVVDAICRIVICSAFLVSSLITLFKEETGIKFGTYSFLGLIIYSIFQLAWFITGAVLYWGDLDKDKVCDAMTIGYMYSVLILGFLTFIANGIVGIKSWL